jgi:hypothetical protein
MQRGFPGRSSLLLKRCVLQHLLRLLSEVEGLDVLLVDLGIPSLERIHGLGRLVRAFVRRVDLARADPELLPGLGKLLLEAMKLVATLGYRRLV